MHLNERIDIILKEFAAKRDSEVFDNIYDSTELTDSSEGDKRRLKSMMQDEGLIECTGTNDMVFIITSFGTKVSQSGGWIKYQELIEINNSRMLELDNIEEGKLRSDAKLARWKTWTFWIGFTFAILVSCTSLYFSLTKREPKADRLKSSTTYESKWNNETSTLKLVRTNADSVKTITEAIERFNSGYQKENYPFARVVKIHFDTAFINIDNSHYLTQQMGTTGADEYLAKLTFTVTELKGINFVNLHFLEGDNAVPGTYERTDFNAENL